LSTFEYRSIAYPLSKKTLEIELATEQDDDRPVYLTGNFNNWLIDDKAFQLKKLDWGKYSFQFPRGESLPNPLEYKYIRGGWENEECDRFGNRRANRVIKKRSGRVKDFVPKWKINGHTYQASYLPKPVILDENFEIPQLIKTRRISALLPHDYYNTDKSYPVLYLQDGQNLFDANAPFGTWGVTKKMAILKERGMGDIIVVAIDHAKEERIEEYTPSQPTKLGSGDGKKYVRFLADTLKPYIDKNFRTKKGPEHTGIGGSSMGGLISLYAGKMYPEVYSKWMIFSPSLWVVPTFKFENHIFQYPFERRVYLYAGKNESVKLLRRINTLSNKITIGAKGNPQNTKVTLSVSEDGEHSEYYWGREFCNAVEWLFFNKK